MEMKHLSKDELISQKKVITSKKCEEKIAIKYNKMYIKHKDLL